MEGEDPGKTPPSLDSSDLKWNNEASPGTLRGISKWSPSLGMTADPQVSLEVLPENPGLTGREEGGLVRGERDGRQMIQPHSEVGPLEESPLSHGSWSSSRLPPLSLTSENNSRKWNHSLTRTENSWEGNHILFLASGGCGAQTPNP